MKKKIMPKVSVIVPVYNTEKYLDKCIQSILSQTFTDFELLLIDDGSTDASGAICDKYAEQDLRVRVFHKENGGVTSARRMGVENAIGEFVTFVDSDDELYSDALSTLLKKTTSKEVKIVVSNLSFEGYIASEEYVKRTLCGRLRNAVWGNLYKRTLLTDWVMDVPSNINFGEDVIMNIKIALNMTLGYAACIEDRVYLYRQNPQSVTYTRVVSLEYDELYIKEIGRALGCRKDEFVAEYYFLKLNVLENLIICKVRVDYITPWVNELIVWFKNKSVTLRHWIVLNIPYNAVCRYLLALERRINKYLS